jgi:hypothetical protein
VVTSHESAAWPNDSQGGIPPEISSINLLENREQEDAVAIEAVLGLEDSFQASKQILADPSIEDDREQMDYNSLGVGIIETSENTGLRQQGGLAECFGQRGRRVKSQ